MMRKSVSKLVSPLLGNGRQGLRNNSVQRFTRLVTQTTRCTSSCINSNRFDVSPFSTYSEREGEGSKSWINMLALACGIGAAFYCGGARIQAEEVSEEIEKDLVESEKQNEQKDTAEETETHDQESTAPQIQLEHYPYVLIGLGAASMAALVQIKRRDRDAKVLIISNEQYQVGDKLEPFVYGRSYLSKELWETTNEGLIKQLMYDEDESIIDDKWFDEVLRKNVTVVPDSVVDISPDRRIIATANDRYFKYDKCLIATGSKRPLPPNATDDAIISGKIQTFHTFGDFTKLREKVKGLKKNQKIVIIGDGFLGSELSSSISSFLKEIEHEVEVVQVLRNKSIAMDTFPSYLSEYATEIMESSGIKFIKNETIKSIDTKSSAGDRANEHNNNNNDNNARNSNTTSTPSTAISTTSNSKDNDESLVIKFASGNQIEADYIVYAGIQSPNVEFTYGRLEWDQTYGGIVVNEELQTSRSRIFAAGDVASFYQANLGRRRVCFQNHASMSGAIAGANMSASPDDNLKTYFYAPQFWSNIGDITVSGIGITDASLHTVGVWVKEENEGAEDTSATIKGCPKHRRGVVYYLKHDAHNDYYKLVGILLWGLGRWPYQELILLNAQTFVLFPYHFTPELESSLARLVLLPQSDCFKDIVKEENK